MNTEHKIVRFYTVVTVCILAVITFIAFLIASFFIHQAKADLPAGEEVLFPANWVLYLSLSFFGLFILGSLLAYVAGKRLATRLPDETENTYQSEKTFIGNASHELNNPLTAIQGECDITLLKERTPLEYQMAIQRISSETKRIILLMKHLLFFSKGEEEVLNASVEQIPLAEFLMQFVQNRVTFSPDSFAFVVKANTSLLKVAIGNLINNALKYSPEDKPVEIHLSVNVLEIKDQGIGIPPADLEQIAQPFFRASNAREQSGHGMGLSLSIRILNTYGAKVTITSEVNVGTCIAISFP